jgi:hypothetical protein
VLNFVLADRPGAAQHSTGGHAAAVPTSSPGGGVEEADHDYDNVVDDEEAIDNVDEDIDPAAEPAKEDKPAAAKPPVPSAAKPPVPSAAKPPVPAAEIPRSSLSVRCSSSDKPAKTRKGGKIVYGADALIDGNLEVAWVEGKGGHGVGEWVELILERPHRLDRIEIWNGYQKVRNDKYGDRFAINERVKDLKVDPGNGKAKMHRLEDKRPPQTIALGGVTSDRVRLQVQSVYEARFTDTAISEVKLYASPVPGNAGRAGAKK